MQIPSNFLRDAKRLFTRTRYTRAKLPVLTHILASLDAQGITLAVTDMDRWLETRIAASPEPCSPEMFLIPLDAMATAIRADKGTAVTFTLRGPRKCREIRVTAQCGGISVESSHPTMDAADFPAKPIMEGKPTHVPARTMESLTVVAGCASTDVTRHVLNGVLFSPEQGGHLIATDGRRLASTPAVVPPKAFILPNAAIHILAHPEFTGRDAMVTMKQEEEDTWVAFRSGNHLLITKTIIGNYPNYKQVIPKDLPELATITGDRRSAVVAWLRALPDKRASVHLTWEKRGHLTLTQRSASNAAAVLRVPVETHGRPPVIAFAAQYLADGLEIGHTLCLKDEMSPGVCKHPGGAFCVIMPMRCQFTAQEVERNNKQAANQAA